MDEVKLRATLEREEGKRYLPYDDATGASIKTERTIRGNLSIGIGRNLENPVSDFLIEAMYEEDKQAAKAAAYRLFPAFDTYADARQRAIVECIFNLGAESFAGFRLTISAILAGDWKKAAYEICDSAWFRELPKRVDRIAHMLETGDDADSAG